MSVRQFRETAEQAALEAGALIFQRYEQKRHAWYKSHREVATQTDKDVEALIRSIIKRKYPAHQFLGEESAAGSIRQGTVSKAKPRKSKDNGAKKYRWVVDPIDGTANFARHIPWFCCSIALEQDGKVIVGVVYDPLHKELFSADAEGQAMLNGKPLRVSERKLKDGLISIAAGFTNKDILKYSKYVGPINSSCKRIRDTGSMTLELCYVAAGRYDASVKVKQHYWDYAAAALIIERAGGRVTDFADKPINQRSKQVVASNGVMHDELLKLIKKSLR